MLRGQPSRRIRLTRISDYTSTIRKRLISGERVVATEVEAYLARMSEICATGGATNETSYYSALENLLNAIGKGLKPRVICNGQIQNQGGGHPDFGLYTLTCH